MAASSNPFRRGSRGWGTLVHQNHGAGGGNGSIMVGMFVCLCLVSKKPSEREFFVPARTDLGVKLFNSLTPIWVRKSSGGNKKLSGGNEKLPLRRIPTVGIARKVPSTQTKLPPQTSSPWCCRLPLLRRSICGSAQSDAGNLFRRGWPRAVTLVFNINC